MSDSPTTDLNSPVIHLHVSGQTDVGQVREHNEDNFLVADLTTKSRITAPDVVDIEIGSAGVVFAVCDGMGGAASGEVASALAVDIIYDKLVSAAPTPNRDELARRLVHAVEAAGLRIYGEAKLDRHHRGMGTTATVAALIDNWLFLAQVGDSRAYIFRRDRLVQVTRDQSLVNQLIEAGQLTEEEAESFEHNNIILQALGTADSVQVDLTFVELRTGDTLMMCSDGLCGMVRLDDMQGVLRELSDPSEVCRTLIAKANEAGGHDNITCIVAKFDGDKLQPPVQDDPVLRYSKYPLPEDSTPEPTSPGCPSAVKGLDQPKIGAEVKQLASGGRVNEPSSDQPANCAFPERVTPVWGRPDSFSGSGDQSAQGNASAPLWLLGTIVFVVFGAIVALALYLVAP